MEIKLEQSPKHLKSDLSFYNWDSIYYESDVNTA